MRLVLFSAAMLLLASAPLLAPGAAAESCVITKPATCVHDPPCVFSWYNEPGCIVPNPCDPRYCDIFLPIDRIVAELERILP